MNTVLVLWPQASRIFRGWFLFGYLGAIAVVLVLELPLWLQLLIIGVVLFGLLRAYQLYELDPIRCLTWQEDGEWLLTMKGNTQVLARLLPSSFNHPWLVILNFQFSEIGKVRSVVLLKDSLPTDAFRQLRRRLTVEKPIASID